MPRSINTSPWQRGEALAIEKIKAIQRHLDNPKRNQPYTVLQHSGKQHCNMILITGTMQTDTTKMIEMMGDDIRQNKQVACTSSDASLWLKNMSQILQISEIFHHDAQYGNGANWWVDDDWWLRWWVMACGKINMRLILHLMLICESHESPFVRPLLSVCSTIVTNIIRWITIMATMRIMFKMWWNIYFILVLNGSVNQTSINFVFKFWLINLILIAHVVWKWSSDRKNLICG